MKMVDCIIARSVRFEKYRILFKEFKAMEFNTLKNNNKIYSVLNNTDTH